MKDFISKKFKNVKLECKQLKKRIKETTATKLFWCELMILVAILMFITTNFIVNFILGMYILSLILFVLGVFAWKYL